MSSVFPLHFCRSTVIDWIVPSQIQLLKCSSQSDLFGFRTLRWSGLNDIIRVAPWHDRCEEEKGAEIFLHQKSLQEDTVGVSKPGRNPGHFSLCTELSVSWPWPSFLLIQLCFYPPSLCYYCLYIEILFFSSQHCHCIPGILYTYN